jgi:FAD/FMN-containing dehydrogenase
MEEARPTRREALKIAGAAAGGAMLTSLGVSAIGTARSATSLSSLARRLDGTLVLPSQSSYPAAASVWNPRLDIRPKAIAFCRSTHDVKEVVRFARERGWPLAARSGRHSFAGYCNCTGIVADVSQMDAIRLDESYDKVTVGAGASNLQIYEQLVVGNSLGLPTGSCPSVGIAGLTLGGGLSRATRLRGMLVDDLLSAKVVLPDGRSVAASPKKNSDLFWALRGGGGGNFGIVTSFTFRTHPTPPLWVLSASYPWTKAAEMFDAWQKLIPYAPPELASSTMTLTRSPDATGEVRLKAAIEAQWWGTQADFEALVEPLQAAGPQRFSIRELPYSQAWAPDGCTVAPNGEVTCQTLPAYDAAYPNYQKSDFFKEQMPAAGIEALVSQVAEWPGGPGAYEGGVHVEALGPGSQANAIKPGATAFVHRDQLFHVAYLSFWGQPESSQANIEWTENTWAAMRPYASGQAYQNYIDGRLTSWREAYYAGNWNRLRKIKRKYDPRNLTEFRQGVTPGS